MNERIDRETSVRHPHYEETMSTIRIREVEDDDSWDAAVSLIGQLWTDADEKFIRSWADEPDYRLFGLYVDSTLAGVAGISIQRVLHHVRHAWVHDFVIDETYRSEGYGAELLSFVDDWAREHDCEYVALAGRLSNERAHRFYERNGMNRWGYILEKQL